MSTVHYLSAARPSPAFEHVVALHCSGSSGRQWDPYVERLPAGLRLAAPDLMGSGRDNAWTLGTPVTLEAEARRVLAAFPGDGAPVHLIGHSYGGAVALEIAMRWPEKVRTLTLYEPVRFAMLDHAETSGIRQMIIETGTRIVQLVHSARLHEAAAMFVDYWSGRGTWDKVPVPRRQAFADRMHKVACEFDALFGDATPAEAYGQLTMPMRLIAGMRSPLPARKVVEQLAMRCRHASVVHLAGLGHMGPVTHPARVVPHLSMLPCREPLAEAA
jgi:pimeloyl-ACP methyl ester carboxylesterase